MNKKEFKQLLCSINLGRIILNIYSIILIGLLIYPPMICILLGLELILLKVYG